MTLRKLLGSLELNLRKNSKIGHLIAKAKTEYSFFYILYHDYEPRNEVIQHHPKYISIQINDDELVRDLTTR